MSFWEKNLAQKYKELNNSFTKHMIFHLGVEGGFFSEYNNMILAMLYCLDNSIRFTLYSSDANFGYHEGWTDFFLPFCQEDKNHYHSRYNSRRPLHLNKISNIQIINFVYNRMFNPLIKKMSRVQNRVVRRRYFPESRTSYFTYELWDRFHSVDMEKVPYVIPALGIKGDITDAGKVLIDLTWRYQPVVEQQIDQIITAVALREPYVGFHIRAGDKFVEHELKQIHTYIEKAETLISLRTAFVLTDDYRIFMELKGQYPTWKFYTLCDEGSTGYYHNAFSKEDKTYKRDQHIKLFASVDMLSKAELFIGTFNSNVGMFLGMRLEKNKCFGIDFDKWRIW